LAVAASREQFIVDHHEATVISQSFAAAEETFGSTQSLLNLRHAFISAASNGVTVLGSSGDGGTANTYFTPVKDPKPIPFPSVEWPDSDPLVTGVGGTYRPSSATRPHPAGTPSPASARRTPPTWCPPSPVTKRLSWGIPPRDRDPPR
jgi:subtilase family serine protease